jgi:glutathione S-transferase
VKVSIMLEETGLPYEAHRVSFETNDQLSPEFIATFPNNKIPAILDPNGPGAGPWPCLNRALVRSIRRALAAFVARPAVALGLVVPQ